MRHSPSSRRRRSRRALCALAAALLFASGDAFAGSLSAEEEAPTVAGDVYVPAAAFRSNNWFGSSDGMWFDLDQGYVTSTDIGAGCISAPVAAPNGSTVVAFVAWLWDSDGAADFTVRLKRRASTGAGAGELASVTTSGSQSAIVPYPDFSIANGTVDNNGFTYFVEMCTSSVQHLHRFYGAQLAF